MPPVVIEELDDDLSPAQHFDHLLRFHEDNAKKLLAATFAFLKQKTSFFDDPDASKVLARLLRDVKGPVTKPIQQPPPSQPSINVGVKIISSNNSQPFNCISQSHTHCIAVDAEEAQY